MIIKHLIDRYRNSLYASEILAFLILGTMIGAVGTSLSIAFIPAEYYGIILLVCLIVGLTVGAVLSQTIRDQSLAVQRIIQMLITICIPFGVTYGAITVINSEIPYVYTIVGIIILTELLFLLDKTVPNHIESRMYFTTKRKAEAFVESVVLFLVIVVTYKGLRSAYNKIMQIDFSQYYPQIYEALKDISIAVAIAVAIYGYIWLNSLRYKNKKE